MVKGSLFQAKNLAGIFRTLRSGLNKFYLIDMEQYYNMPGIPTTFNMDKHENVLDLIRAQGPRHLLNTCPRCSVIQPTGTFKTNSIEKKPLKKYRVVSGNINHGEYDTLELAQAGACGSNAEILTREEQQ